MAWDIARRGDTAGWHELDDVGAPLFVFPDTDPRLIGTVNDAVAPTWMGQAMIEAVIDIAVAGRRAQRLEGNPQAGSRPLAGINGVAKSNGIVAHTNIARTGGTL